MILIFRRFLSNSFQVTLRVDLSNLRVLNIRSVLTRDLIRNPRGLTRIRITIRLQANVRVLRQVSTRRVRNRTIKRSVLTLRNDALLDYVRFLMRQVFQARVLVRQGACQVLACRSTLIRHTSLNVRM